jgi:hypothetical protein
MPFSSLTIWLHDPNYIRQEYKLWSVLLCSFPPASSHFLPNIFKYSPQQPTLERAGVAQSVQWLTTDWTTRVRFPTEAEDFPSTLCVQTGPGANQASCPMGTGDSFPGVKRGRGVMLTTHPHLVPRFSMSRRYTSSPPMFLHGVTFHYPILEYHHSAFLYSTNKPHTQTKQHIKLK